MISTFILSVALLGAADRPAATTTAADAALDEYRAAVARTGKSADAQVRLALWCEAHGLTAERMKHLALAVLYEPSNVLARGLLGFVAYQGKWENPDQVSRAIENDATRKARIREYLVRRANAPDRAADQWKLAMWCEQNGLKGQATAHLFRVVQLDPSRDSAWKRLGYKRMSGRWDKPERAAAAKAEVRAQASADKHWKPLLERWRDALSSRDKSKRDLAEKSLAGVTDPRAVPMIWVVFARGSAAQQTIAVRLLGQIDSPGSSRAIALLALSTETAEVRGAATQILRRRDARDFAGVLIALFGDPIKYEVRRVNGPGSQGQLLIKQPDVNVKRLYSPLSGPNVAVLPGDSLSVDAYGLPVLLRPVGSYQTGYRDVGNLTGGAIPAAFGLPTLGENAAHISGLLSQAGVSAALSQRLGSTFSPLVTPPVIGPQRAPKGGKLLAAADFNREMAIPLGQMMIDAQMSAQVAQAQLASDVQALDDYNRSITDTNQRARQLLTDSVGIDRGVERLKWEKWLVDLQGYAFSAQSPYEPPTVVEQVPIAYQPQATPHLVNGPTSISTQQMLPAPPRPKERGYACFAAGTFVRTLDGSTEIERLRPGDVVLTQEPATGELKYQPLLTVYHNPPNTTLRIAVGDETIVATGIHRFWKAGRGWVMARDLKPGDALRTVGGLAIVKSVDADNVQPVFNLRVADGESFFVGQLGVLVHDNSLVNPTPSPFDAVPDLDRSAAAGTTAGH
jgi:Pretoxin HINT domain